VGFTNNECLSCNNNPEDTNILKWQGRVFNPATSTCDCKPGFQEIGSRDCYNLTFNSETLAAQ
jgi:hypothetical protein